MNSPLPSCDVSVILPARDEERTIGECITKIQEVFSREKINGEIIIADSSEDRTGEIAASLGATVVRPEKIGYGNAYLAGFAAARGRFIVMGDADNTYDFLELSQLIEPLKHGADLVVGSRFRGTLHAGSMTPCTSSSGTRFLPGFSIISSTPGILTRTAVSGRSAVRPLTVSS